MDNKSFLPSLWPTNTFSLNCCCNLNKNRCTAEIPGFFGFFYLVQLDMQLCFTVWWSNSRIVLKAKWLWLKSDFKHFRCDLDWAPNLLIILLVLIEWTTYKCMHFTVKALGLQSVFWYLIAIVSYKYDATTQKYVVVLAEKH